MMETVPPNVRVLPNGAWQSKVTGRIVKAPPGAAWDSDTARKMSRRRHEKARLQKVKAAQTDGLMDEVAALSEKVSRLEAQIGD